MQIHLLSKSNSWWDRSIGPLWCNYIPHTLRASVSECWLLPLSSSICCFGLIDTLAHMSSVKSCHLCTHTSNTSMAPPPLLAVLLFGLSGRFGFTPNNSEPFVSSSLVWMQPPSSYMKRSATGSLNYLQWSGHNSGNFSKRCASCWMRSFPSDGFWGFADGLIVDTSSTLRYSRNTNQVVSKLRLCLF